MMDPNMTKPSDEPDELEEVPALGLAFQTGPIQHPCNELCILYSADFGTAYTALCEWPTAAPPNPARGVQLSHVPGPRLAVVVHSDYGDVKPVVDLLLELNTYRTHSGRPEASLLAAIIAVALYGSSRIVRTGGSHWKWP